MKELKRALDVVVMLAMLLGTLPLTLAFFVGRFAWEVSGDTYALWKRMMEPT